MPTQTDHTDILATFHGLSGFQSAYLFEAFPGTPKDLPLQWAPGEAGQILIEARVIWGTAPEKVVGQLSKRSTGPAANREYRHGQRLGTAVASHVYNAESTALHQFGRPGRAMADHIESSPVTAAVRALEWEWMPAGGWPDSRAGWGRRYGDIWHGATWGHQHFDWMGRAW